MQAEVGITSDPETCAKGLPRRLCRDRSGDAPGLSSHGDDIAEAQLSATSLLGIAIDADQARFQKGLGFSAGFDSVNVLDELAELDAFGSDLDVDNLSDTHILIVPRCSGCAHKEMRATSIDAALISSLGSDAGDLASLDAGGAHVQALRGLAHHGANSLDVGVPAALGPHVRVRN